jgi:hypothetical protein
MRTITNERFNTRRQTREGVGSDAVRLGGKVQEDEIHTPCLRRLKPIESYLSGLLFEPAVDPVKVLHHFGLASAPSLFKRNPTFARKLLLQLFRQMLSEGGDFADMYRLARYLVRNPATVKFDRGVEFTDETDFCFRLKSLLRLHRELPGLVSEFATFGCAHARAAILARGRTWARCLILLLHEKRSTCNAGEVVNFAKWCLKNPGKILGLDRMENVLDEAAGGMGGWLSERSWTALH